MKKFKIVPLSADYVRNIKDNDKDEFGHRLVMQSATGLGPCRVSLKVFKIGVDRRILFTHSPFEIDNAYDQPGPVFINADEVEEYSDIYRFPPEIKNDGLHFRITLIGYSDNQMMKLTHLCEVEEQIDETIGKIFDSRPDIAYLHARNAIACCFICKIERASDDH